MDMNISQHSWTAHRQQDVPASATSAVQGGPVLDWHALRARLVAARSLRTILTESARKPRPVCASFDSRIAKEFSAIPDASRPVNLTASAYGKCLGGNEGGIDGAFEPGVRG